MAYRHTSLVVWCACGQHAKRWAHACISQDIKPISFHLHTSHHRSRKQITALGSDALSDVPISNTTSAQKTEVTCYLCSRRVSARHNCAEDWKTIYALWNWLDLNFGELKFTYICDLQSQISEQLSASSVQAWQPPSNMDNYVRQGF